MAAPRFYIPSPLEPGIAGTSFILPDDVAHHAVRVLRLQIGAPVRLFDGRGGEYRGTIDRVDRHGASARIDRFDPIEREWPGAPVLALALIATDPMDAAVRKAVELGVASIIPVIATRSQGTLSGARAEKRLLHWRSIAIAACEQCGRNRVPSIGVPLPFEAWVRTMAPSVGPAVILGPGSTHSLASVATRVPPRLVAIGPEGGFTEPEISLAVARGLVPVHLGPRVLRADTAAVAVLAMLAALCGDVR